MYFTFIWKLAAQVVFILHGVWHCALWTWNSLYKLSVSAKSDAMLGSFCMNCTWLLTRALCRWWDRWTELAEEVWWWLSLWAGVVHHVCLCSWSSVWWRLSSSLSTYGYYFVFIVVIITLHASCSAVYCNRSCLWVWVFVGVLVRLLPQWLEITCIDPHQTEFVGKGSDHL